jgi:hypothetical protein
MATHGRISSFALAVLAAGLGFVSGAAVANDAAHDLSDKFSGPPAAPAPARSAPKSEEAEMLEKARREAAERIAAQKSAAAASNAQLEKQRDEELARISEKLRKAREAREARIARGEIKPAPAQKPSFNLPWQTDVTAAPIEKKAPEFDTSERSALGVAPSRPEMASGRYTVLLTMAPGDRGIRRLNKRADPVLCTNDGCWISRGPDLAAELRADRRVFGLSNVFGARAGACSNQLGCVFRGIELREKPSFLQPVDLRMISHDRRLGQVVHADSQCAVTRGQLSCKQPFAAGDYTMWIVPEALANDAGVEALKRVVTADIAPPRASVSWQPLQH